MDDEKLIECVKQHTVLYNVEHDRYQDITLKNKIWKEIGLQLQQSSSHCKSRWNNIRDNLRKSIKKRLSTGKANSMRKYKYEDKLGFLISLGNSKTPFTTIVKRAKLELDKNEESQTECEDHSEESESYIDNTEKVIVIEDRSDPATNNKINPIELRTQVNEPSVAKKEKFVAEPPQRVLLSRVPNTRTDDAVDAFLAGLAPTLKSLTPYYLNLAKTKIFSIVQEFELEMITEAEQAQTSNEPYFLKPEFDYHSVE